MKSSQQQGTRKARLASVLALLALLTSLGASALATSEYQLKAVFLFNFAQFVEWPRGAFDAPDDELRICVVGQDPFGPELEAVMQGESIGGRPIEIQRFANAPEVDGCHLIYVNQTEGELRQTLDTVKGKPVLTVGETEAFTSLGGMIRFYMEGNKVRLRINPTPADEAQLRLSSKLLRSSQIVAKETGNAR